VKPKVSGKIPFLEKSPDIPNLLLLTEVHPPRVWKFSRNRIIEAPLMVPCSFVPRSIVSKCNAPVMFSRVLDPVVGFPWALPLGIHLPVTFVLWIG